MRFLPLAGVLLIVAVACGWRPWLQYRRHGTSGILIFRAGSPGQTFRDTMMVLLIALLLAQAIVAAGRPEPVVSLLHVAGAVFMLAGIGLLIVGQLHLGASWRIGIDENAAPGLVDSGIYRFSRNPIFLALAIFVAGYTLVLPTRLSVALLVGTLIGIRLQVRAEETYLLSAYGESYREYARRVGRFLPGMGRLR
jgi:protein-S-isoprenylcysteine O-methyltransferase Ste14